MYFNLFPYNIPVAGKEQAVIYDLQNERLIRIPLYLCKILNKLKTNAIKTLCNNYKGEDKIVFNKYIEFLEKKKLGVFSPKRLNFKNIDTHWDSPGSITIAVVEIDVQTPLYDLTTVIKQLSILGCKCLELRLNNLNKNNTIHLQDWLNGINESDIRELVIYIEYDISLSPIIFDELKKLMKIQTDIILLKCPNRRINFGEYKILDEKESERVLEEKDLTHYIVNMKVFTENQQFNCYYNKRVSISKDGAIKNCLSLKKEFGNVRINDIEKSTSSNSFRYLWNMSPDKIEDVKNSEFRYAIYSNKDVLKTETGQNIYNN